MSENLIVEITEINEGWPDCDWITNSDKFYCQGTLIKITAGEYGGGDIPHYFSLNGVPDQDPYPSWGDAAQSAIDRIYINKS